MKQTKELHIAVFKDLIKRLINEKPGLIIFDRLYLTQAFRAGVSISEYSELENILSKYDTITVFLKVDENHIADRVTTAAEHRDPTWREYINTKGRNSTEIANYYISQQRKQLDLLNRSNLPTMVCDTSNHEYEEISQKILNRLHLK